MLNRISVIIPCYNEENNLPSTYLGLASLPKRIKCSLEIIFVNDCSSDNTLSILKKFKKINRNVKIIDLKERSGAWVAFKIGLKNSDSDYATLLPADMQIPASIIKKFIERINEKKGLEVIYARGYPHGNGAFSTLFWSWLFFRFINKIIINQVDAFFINKRIIKEIKNNKELHNVVPYEIFKSNYYDFIMFRKSPRKFGKSKYNFLSDIQMFSKTILLSLNTRFISYKNPKYDIIV